MPLLHRTRLLTVCPLYFFDAAQKFDTVGFSAGLKKDLNFVKIYLGPSIMRTQFISGPLKLCLQRKR